MHCFSVQETEPLSNVTRMFFGAYAEIVLSMTREQAAQLRDAITSALNGPPHG